MKLTRKQEETLIQIGLNTLLQRELDALNGEPTPSKATLAAQRAWATRRAKQTEPAPAPAE